MDKEIYENKSLQELISILNSGTHGIEDVENIIIHSPKRQGILIKVLMMDIADQMHSILSQGVEALGLAKFENKFRVETDLLDFIVFTMIDEDTPGTYILINMPLIEYIVSARNFNDELDIMDRPEWNLIEFESDNKSILTEIELENFPHA